MRAFDFVSPKQYTLHQGHTRLHSYQLSASVLRFFPAASFSSAALARTGDSSQGERGRSSADILAARIPRPDSTRRDLTGDDFGERRTDLLWRGQRQNTHLNGQTYFLRSTTPPCFSFSMSFSIVTLLDLRAAFSSSPPILGGVGNGFGLPSRNGKPLYR